jgi:polyisoprenoid-binding protein YceI
MTTQRWDIDTSHSGVHFTVRHMVIAKVRGAFGRWQGSIDFDAADPTQSKVEVAIDTASIDTREPKRDEHLRSPDFLDVAQFPQIAFKSTRIARDGEDRYRVDGELTIHGVTRPVVLEVEGGSQVKDPWGNTRTGFSATTTISRKEFGLTWNVALEAGGFLVGDRLDINLEIEAIKKAATAAA